MIHHTRDVCTPGRAHIVCKKPNAKTYFGIGGNDIVLGSVYPSGYTGSGSGSASLGQSGGTPTGFPVQAPTIQAPVTNQSFSESIQHNSVNSANSAIDLTSSQIGENCHTAHVPAHIPVVPGPDCFTVMGLFLAGLIGLISWRRQRGCSSDHA
jgi:hypothetical protein